MSDKTIIMLVSAAVLTWGSLSSASEIVVRDSLLTLLVEEMIAANPSLESYRYSAESQQALVTVESSWADPKIILGAMNFPVDTWDLNQEAMTGLWITASQTVPLTSKNRLKYDAADKIAEVSRLRIQAETFRKIEELAAAWYDWNFSLESVRILDRMISNYDAVIANAITQYRSGQKPQSAVFRLETARSKLREQKLDHLQMSRAASRKTAALLGKSPPAEILNPRPVETIYPPLNPGELSAVMLEHNPAIIAARKKFEAAELRENISRLSWRPDLILSAGYGYRQDSDAGLDRPDFFSLSAAFSLPVFGARKQGKVVQASLSMTKQAEADLRQTELQLHTGLHTLIDEDLKLSGQIELYREEIIPQSNSAVEAALTEFTTGASDVNTVILAWNNLVLAENNLLSKIRDRNKLRVRISSLAGQNEYISGALNEN